MKHKVEFIRQVKIQDEIQYVIEKAHEGEICVVTLNSLVFFSTSTGDAWLLDPSDGLALCLARGGSPQGSGRLSPGRRAISALGAIDLPMDRWGVDLMIAGSQKALALPPGLALVGRTPPRVRSFGSPIWATSMSWT